MSDDLLNILSHSNKDIDNQVLMDYLAGKLSAQQRHEVEQLLAENQFMNDAVEGLEHVANKKDISRIVDQLNGNLQKKLEQKKSRKEKRKLADSTWTYVAILLIIILAIVSFIIINQLNRP
ncbi:MAG: hypothetical protein H7Y03_00080 [Chitinophagaceae bacterium]|nr:hypothetical protein [Chitinophagaceae bacterium]